VTCPLQRSFVWVACIDWYAKQASTCSAEKCRYGRWFSRFLGVSLFASSIFCSICFGWDFGIRSGRDWRGPLCA
jgi:hypothetical protein